MNRYMDMSQMLSMPGEPSYADGEQRKLKAARDARQKAMEQIYGISEMGDRQKMLENQIEQAQQSQDYSYSTPIGAMLGGLGNIGEKIGGGVASAKLSDLLRQRTDAIKALMEERKRQEEEQRMQQGPMQPQQQAPGLAQILRDRQRPENNMLGQYFLQPPEMY